MEIVYALEQPPEAYTKAIFLAGPTPRSAKVLSWRPAALALLEKLSYDGVVFVPEDRNGAFHGDYDGQIAWEDRCLNVADVILFWVPRDMRTMPGLTTNVEFGRWEDSGKIVLGLPASGVKNTYLESYANKLHIPRAKTLHKTVSLALDRLGDGCVRRQGEREVPLHIWRTDSFQRWYGAQTKAGNVLRGAQVVWTFRFGAEQERIFSWALLVDVYVTSEKRSKVNEFVLSRPDISTVVMYHRNRMLEDWEIVLVKEFRSPATTTDGFVRELPGGSSADVQTAADQVAVHEIEEETGVRLPASRLVRHESRQLMATLSAHRAHLFSVELTSGELAALRSQIGVTHGVRQDSERTYVEITTLNDIRHSDTVDWSMLGMLLQILT